jgi:putative ABC transport system permease protein
MRMLRRWIRRFIDWSTASRREREVAAELEAHVELHAADNVRAGMSPAEARRVALMKLGGVEHTREAMRDVWSVRGIETLAQDTRYAVRGLLRSPVFTLTAIASLALGLGAGIAIFTVADSLLIRSLPYPAASQLVTLRETNRVRPDNPGFENVSPGNYFDWKTQGADLFEAIGGYRVRSVIFSDGARVEELRRFLVTADVLPLLGAQPILGRVFSREDDRPEGSTPVVSGPLVISHRVWQQWFGGDPAIIGRTVQINATPRTIIGVLPSDFYFRDREVDLWEPLGLNPAYDYRHREGRWMLCVGRLKPGVTYAQAQARMTTIAARTEAAYPDINHDMTVVVSSLREAMVWNLKTPLLILLAAVALLLTVSCANVAGLLLARSDGRRRELAVRASLGAGRWRVVRLLLVESLILGLVSGLAALLMAYWLVAGLVALAPKALVRGVAVSVDWRIVAFGIALSLFTAVLFGLAPALMATGRTLVNQLRDDSRTATASVAGSRRGGRIRGWLVSAEIAFTVVLLIGAVLLFRTLVGLNAVRPGLDPSNVITMRVSIPGARYKTVTQRTQFFARALADIEQLPGVRAAGAVSDLPFVRASAGTYVQVEGEPPPSPAERRMAAIRVVTPGYFKAMGIPLRSGREFTDADNIDPDLPGAPPMRFVVNEAFVKTFLGDRPASTTRVMVPMNPTNPFGDIIGVIADVQEDTLDKPATPTAYYIHSRLNFTSLVLVVRTQGDPLDLVEPIRRTIARIDPAQPIAEVRTMDDVVGETLARQRFSAVLLSAFSMLSLLLACVGIYGVLAYAVSQRTREIGVRVALGARPSGIIWLVLQSGARMVAIGLIAGLAIALALSRVIASLLFGVGPRDLPTFLIVPITLASIALIAATLPALGAARLDPTTALRGD